MSFGSRFTKFCHLFFSSRAGNPKATPNLNLAESIRKFTCSSKQFRNYEYFKKFKMNYNFTRFQGFTTKVSDLNNAVPRSCSNSLHFLSISCDCIIFYSSPSVLSLVIFSLLLTHNFHL